MLLFMMKDQRWLSGKSLATNGTVEIGFLWFTYIFFSVIAHVLLKIWELDKAPPTRRFWTFIGTFTWTSKITLVFHLIIAIIPCNLGWVARHFAVWRTHTRTSIIDPQALSHRTSFFDDRTRTRTSFISFKKKIVLLRVPFVSQYFFQHILGCFESE